MVIQPTPNLTQPLPDLIQHESICMGLPKLTVNMYNYRMHVAAHTVKVGYIHVNTTHIEFKIFGAHLLIKTERRRMVGEIILPGTWKLPSDVHY